MFFLPPPSFDQSVVQGPAPVSVAVMFWPGQFCPPAIQAQNWEAIYRMAYEQLIAAFAPSAFQRMIEPSMN
jgi:hypothetical protein